MKWLRGPNNYHSEIDFIVRQILEALHLTKVGNPSWEYI